MGNLIAAAYVALVVLFTVWPLWVMGQLAHLDSRPGTPVESAPLTDGKGVTTHGTASG